MFLFCSVSSENLFLSPCFCLSLALSLSFFLSLHPSLSVHLTLTLAHARTHAHTHTHIHMHARTRTRTHARTHTGTHARTHAHNLIFSPLCLRTGFTDSVLLKISTLLRKACSQTPPTTPHPHPEKGPLTQIQSVAVCDYPISSLKQHHQPLPFPATLFSRRLLV